MDIYTRKSLWKIYLAIAGILIMAISVVYTNYLVGKLKEEERKKVETWALALEEVNQNAMDTLTDFTLHNKIISENTTIPMILVNDRGGIEDARNFGDDKDTDKVFLKKELEGMKEEMKIAGIPPIYFSIYDVGQAIYYKNSRILTLLTYFPIVQFFLIAAFIALGYVGFSTARRSEQNQVWVGMAKETAHQLGTPISAILAWIEHLRLMHDDNAETQEVVNELDKDVDRLKLIAERFSKIGASPELTPINIYSQLEECRSYMQRRSPRKVKFEFPDPQTAPFIVNINAPLFDWVIENLLRNALDAMESGTGTIKAEVYEEKSNICIEVSDTGKGIPSNKFKTVFQPGYTTKKRGWGLGLSLAKRIVESYHNGKILVKKSNNEGTTFLIKLPKL
jgi:two-component sensor histidine kinase